MLIYFEIEP